MTSGKGIKGVVVDGGIRDIQEHRDLKFPVGSMKALQLIEQVHARYHSTLGQATFVRPSFLNVPVTIHPLPPLSEPPFPSVDVSPGDIMICDMDGCVVIPQGMVADVAALAKRLKAIDEKVRIDLIAGRGVQETMKKHRG
jgi:regulator of RNase E activity RraA